MKPLTADGRKDVFIIDDSLFDRSRSGKTELLAKVFDHCSMKYKRGYRGLDTIAMVKKSSKIKYGYQDGRFNIKEIYAKTMTIR